MATEPPPTVPVPLPGHDPHEETDRRTIQRLLQAGLASGFLLMLAGLVVKLVNGNGTAPTVRLFRLGQRGGPGDTVMAVGILVLALTPALRVLTLIALWAREHDWHYVRVAVVVLVVLAVAAGVGHG